MSIEHPFLFSREDALANAMDNEIATFWASRQQGQFVGRDGLRLNWCAFTKPEHTRAIVVVNGRIEGVDKYREIFFDLFQQGFDVYSHDHRGQGHSQRLVTGSDIGHVVNFEDYVDDLESFINLVVTNKSHRHRLLLAHSMGGAISTLYAARKPRGIDALALSAPMFGINLSRFMQHAAKPLCKTLSKLQHPSGFAPGQVPYWSKPFQGNLLTQSEPRYQWFRKLYEDDETLKVGGPSTQWIWQSLDACERVMKAATEIELPVLLMQGARDQVVNNDAMFDFFRARQAANLPIQFEILANARHELLFEQDVIRDKALTLALTFFTAQGEAAAALEQTA